MSHTRQFLSYSMFCFYVSAGCKEPHGRLAQDADRNRSEQYAGTVEHCRQVSDGKKI